MNRQRRPPHPRLVLLVAVVLPGGGHVLVGLPTRGLAFAFFTLMLGWVSFHLTTPEHSLLGRYAGGWFVHAMSLLDAYKWGKVRHAEHAWRSLAPDRGGTRS